MLRQLVILAAAGLCLIQARASQSDKRPFSVADAIAVTRMASTAEVLSAGFASPYATIYLAIGFAVHMSNHTNV